VMRCRSGTASLQVRDNLMPEEVEVDPVRGAAAFRTAQRGSVERARGIQIVDGKSDVEWIGQGSLVIAA
jgi:hypothetical protein